MADALLQFQWYPLENRQVISSPGCPQRVCRPTTPTGICPEPYLERHETMTIATPEAERSADTSPPTLSSATVQPIQKVAVDTTRKAAIRVQNMGRTYKVKGERKGKDKSKS